MGQAKKGNKNRITVELGVETVVKGIPEVTSQSGQFHPPQVDVYETRHSVLILVDLPGVSKEDIDLYIEKNMIVLEATKKERRAPQKARYFCIERFFGKFQRAVEIPATVNTGKTRAILKNGVLKIELPKIEDRRGAKKRIEIEE